ncbi:MAG: RNA polymerase sigma factor [Saprospiraceae bacterium]
MAQIHKCRHTYREGEPVLPEMFAIAKHVQVDGYRRSHRIYSREKAMYPPPEPPQPSGTPMAAIPDFGILIAALRARQREGVSLLKGSGMSLEEVARATASRMGSVKLKAHRVYQKLRSILSAGTGENLVRSSDEVV